MSNITPQQKAALGCGGCLSAFAILIFTGVFILVAYTPSHPGPSAYNKAAAFICAQEFIKSQSPYPGALEFSSLPTGCSEISPGRLHVSGYYDLPNPAGLKIRTKFNAVMVQDGRRDMWLCENLQLSP